MKKPLSKLSKFDLSSFTEKQLNQIKEAFDKKGYAKTKFGLTKFIKNKPVGLLYSKEYSKEIVYQFFDEIMDKELLIDYLFSYMCSYELLKKKLEEEKEHKLSILSKNLKLETEKSDRNYIEKRNLERFLGY